MEDKIVRLAALLHDIGKFWQGTGESGTHAELSCRFIRDYVPERWKGAAGLIASHHDHSKCTSKGYKPLKTVVCADWLSSGERRELPGGEERGKRRDTPLESIFSEIDIGKGKSASKYYYPIRKLELNKEVIFPKTLEEGERGRLRKDYEDLWEAFVGEVEDIKALLDFDAYFTTLCHLLQKYAWCVPSAVYWDVPDISLFDHLKTSCAIASCLDDADENFLNKVLSGLEKGHRKEELSEEEKGALGDNKFLLIGGDVSGVQKFIYSITSKGAAKGLRGRSFYLELFSESIAKYILRELDLPITNLLYCGGGHFYILAPSIVDTDLKRLRGEIAERLLKIHRGELYLVLDWLFLSADDFKKEKFGRAWEEIGIKLAGRKKKKFEEILELREELREEIFGPFDVGGTRETCDICGSEERVKEEEERRICNFCKSLEDLARDIARANYWIEAWKKELTISDKEEGSWKEALSRFGVEYEFEESVKWDWKIRDADHIMMYKLNDTNFSELISEYSNVKSPVSLGFKFLAKETPYLTKEIPDIEGRIYKKEEIKDFGDLAEDSEGIKRWAVLRADVDNLGKIFSEGLGEDRTISRMSNLSFMLSLFFRGWMAEICEKTEYKNDVYAIYSGGDDLFLVGGWAKMPEVGKTIYEDFRAFTCVNPNITLSAGVTIAPSKKYPLYQAAELAREALDNSKSLEEKDGVTFLEKPMRWNKFNVEVTELKDELKKLLEAGVPRALLQKLNVVYSEYRRQRLKYGGVSAKYDDRYGRWRWVLAYVIARMKGRDEGVNANLEKLESMIYENIEYVPIAVRWIEFLTREEKEVRR